MKKVKIYKRRFKKISLLDKFCLLFKKPFYTRNDNIIIKAKKFNNKIYCLDIIEVENE